MDQQIFESESIDFSRNRRALFGAIGGTVVAAALSVGVPPAPGRALAKGADAELIRDCEEYCALARKVHELFSANLEEEAREVLLVPIKEQLGELAEKISEAKAVSQEAHAARARCFYEYEGPDLFEDTLLWEGAGFDIVAALIRDLVSVAQ